MKKTAAIFFLMFSVIASAVAADKPLGIDEYTSIDELAMAITTYFPKVQGEVKAMQSNSLTVALGKKDGLMPGMALSLWRDSKEILHPLTHAVIGRAEEEIGSVEATVVNESSSQVMVIKKIKEPALGDKARITPKKINLALIPVRVERPEVAQGLAERLTEYGRFSVLESGKVAAFLKDKPQRDTSLVRDMGHALGLDAVVALGVYPSEGRLMVTARIFYAEDARPLDTIVAMLDLKSKKDSIAEVKPYFAPVREETASTPELPVDARFFVTGDFEGKGIQEYAFSDGTGLHIYRLEQGGWREAWTEIVLPADHDIQHISLDAADINGNGAPELFVTAMLNGRVFSYVVEFHDKTFRRIAEMPGFVRVLDLPGKGSQLVGQDYDAASFYIGRPRQYSWSNGKYLRGPEFSLPNALGLYGFVFAGVGEPNPLLIVEDDKDHLIVYSGETLIWKSEELYSGIDTMVARPASGVDAALSRTVTDSESGRKARINARILALDLNNDAKEEVVIPRNTGGFLSGAYSSAELHGMRWNGSRLEQAWSIKGIPGAVLDLHAERLEGGAVQIRALVKVPGGLFSSDSIVVMTYAGK